MEELLLAFILVIANFVLYGCIWFKSSKPKTQPDSIQNSVIPTVPECELETAEEKLPVFALNPERDSSSNVSEIDEDTEESKVDKLPVISEEDIKRLEDDHKFYRKEISQYQRKFQNLSIIVTGFEDIQQENEKLNREIASLQEIASKNDSDRKATEWHLRQDNADLHEKLDKLEKETRMVTDRRQEQQSPSTISPQNDKRAASLRETAFKWESDCLATKFQLTQENIALKKSLGILKSESQTKTAELNQVAIENRMLNSNLKLSLETLNAKLEVLDQLQEELYELKCKYQATTLQNNQLEKELSASREIISKMKVDYPKIASKLTMENDDLRAKLDVVIDSNYKIKQEMETAFQSANQAKDLVDDQTKAISQLKADLQLANQENQVQISRNEQLQAEFAEFKKNAAVIQRQNDELRREMVKLKESVMNRKTYWRAFEQQLTQENSDLKMVLGRLQSENQRISHDHEAAVLSAQLSTNQAKELAENREAENEIRQLKIFELQTKLEKCQLQNDELKKNEAFLRETTSNSKQTVSQLRKEMVDLKAEMENQKEAFSSELSELGRIKDENHVLKTSLDSVNGSLAAKLAEKSLLDLKSDEFEKNEIDLRHQIEFLQKENQQMWKTRESAVLSAEKAEKLAQEQVAELSDALAALQVAVTHAKDGAAAAETTESTLRNIDETDSDSTPTGKDSRVKKWFNKHSLTTRKPVQENELIKLLRSTGLSMMERAKHLQEQAENIKVKGKQLKKKAKELSRN